MLKKLAVLIFFALFQSASAGIKTPADFFGFQPGADRMLFDYNSLISYFEELDAASARLKLVDIGESPMGRRMVIAFISSEENIARLADLQKINKKLALSAALSESDRRQLVNDGKVFVLATLSMHSNEVAPTQASPLIAHELVTTTDPELLEWLSNVVYMMVPCHNPDGMDMVVAHYNKYKGTKYEGSSMPGIYHKYVGHDNNRDFVTLSQSDTRAIARIYNLDWFPQVMVEKHQMGLYTARYFVPPMHDPIAENIDAELWNWTTLFGANMITDMTKSACPGVSQHYLFDDYWPGSTETALWKNVIAMLTEAASAKYATPVFIEPGELSAGGKGLAEYKKSINMPQPWPGGWWRLSDIVHYEIVSTKSIIKTASMNRKTILQFQNDICKKEVEKGKSEPPFYYILPKKQHDESEFLNLLALLQEHGIQLFQLKEGVTLNNRDYAAGDVVVPLAQPFRAFIKEVLEAQTFPLRHYTPDGDIIKPYDITTWSLPLHRGVAAMEIKTRSLQLESSLQQLVGNLGWNHSEIPAYTAAVFSADNNESFKAAFAAMADGNSVLRLQNKAIIQGKTFAAGSFIVKGKINEKWLNELTVAPHFVNKEIKAKAYPLKLPRIALVETYFHDMDAGWTRFIFDAYKIPFHVIRPGELRKIDLKKYDILIFPDADKNVLISGKYKSGETFAISDYPPEFTKGMGKEGLQKVAAFLNDGGLVLSWGRSTTLFTDVLDMKKGAKEIESFKLPIKNISKRMTQKGLYCPGSLLKVELLSDHPLTLGMPKETGVFYRGRPVFATSVPTFDMDRRVIGYFPQKDILMSGYCEKANLLAQKPVLVWLKKGRGQMVLYGFNPQFRASTQGTFRLLFNALLLAKSSS